LQRQRCKFLQRHGSLARFENYFFKSTLKNDLGYYNAGVVAANSKVVGSAPGSSVQLYQSRYQHQGYFPSFRQPFRTTRVARFFLGTAYQNGGKMYQMTTKWAIKYAKIFHFATLPDLPKLVFLF
jgi:hypothetical protein